MRTLDEIKSYVSRPRNGSAETIAAPGWRLFSKLAPKAQVVVIRRPVGEVVESVMNMPSGVTFDPAALVKLLAAVDRKLDQIEARLPCLSVKFSALARESSCAEIFEYCLPYRHDRDHWARLEGVNIQVNARRFFKHSERLRSNLAALASIAKAETFRELSWQQ